MSNMEKDLQFESEKAAKYLGTARIQLHWLSFQDSVLDAKHVQVLKLSFEGDCRRLDVRNHVPAIIDQQSLDSALRLSGISQAQLSQSSQHQPPELGFWAGYQLECLHGRHRVQAAKLALAPPNKWWTVDLYLADISSDLRTALTEEYANEEKPSDGKVYQKIRRYRREKKASLEVRWWTRLSPHKASNLRQLLQHSGYALAFDSFLELPALLTGMRISTLHKMFAIRCDKEILHYLRYIKDFWSELLQQDKTAMARIDQVTVEKLQLKAPWASTMDAKILRGKILGGELFRLFSQQEREQIWVRLQNFKGVVPSLFEFFENLKCLETWTDCLKWLFTLDPRETVFMAMKRIHTDRDQSIDSALVQESEVVFQTVPATRQDRLNLGYRQLYFFAMRYHRDIPKKPTGKDLLARPTPRVNLTRLGQMADLASRLGFESSEINALREYPRSADSTVATESHRPFLVTNGPGEERYRCGIPRIEDYEANGRYMFVHHLHDNTHEQGERITFFFRFRSMYMKFFGVPYSESTGNGDAANVDHQRPGNAVGEPLRPLASDVGELDLPESHQMYDLEAVISDEGSNEIEAEETASLEQQPDLFSEEQEHQMEQVMKYLSRKSSLLQEITQDQQQLRITLASSASALQGQEHQQEQLRNKLASSASALQGQEHQQEQLRNTLASSASALQEQEHQQQQTRRQLRQEENALKTQAQELELCRQRLDLDANAPNRQRQEDESLQSSLIIYKASESMDTERTCEQERQVFALDASDAPTQGEKSKGRRRKPIKDVGQPENRVRQQEKRKRRSKREKIKQKDKLTEGYVIGRKQDELHTSQEQEERTHEELQRQSQEGLWDLEESTPLEEASQEGFPAEVAQKDDTQTANVPAPQENRMYSNIYNEYGVREDETAQNQTLYGRARTKRGRDYREVDEEDEEIQARQRARGQKLVQEGKYQRLNTFSGLNDEDSASSAL